MLNSFRYVMPALRQVFSSRKYLAAFLIISIAIAAAYTYLLKFSEFELFGKASIFGISLPVITLSVLMGILFSLALVMDIYSAIRSLKGAAGIGIAALLTSILPSSLCCTTLIPSLLAIGGASTATIIGLTGKIQGPIAALEPTFIAASFAMLLFGLVYSSKSIYATCCKSDPKAHDQRFDVILDESKK